MIRSGKNERSHKGNFVNSWVPFGLLGQQEEPSQLAHRMGLGSNLALQASFMLLFGPVNGCIHLNTHV
jgi:hypothetical protein